MTPLSSSAIAITTTTIATALLGFPAIGLRTLPAVAHTVQSSGEVAATFHLEPNHNPRAGETAQVWFALTERGGAIVPLDDCDCRLAVYAEPRQAGDTPIAEPTLTAIAAEQYRDIPGASVVFPQPGRYVLEFSGQPAGAATFAPFQFRYTTTVLATANPPTSAPVATSPTPSPTTSPPNPDLANPDLANSDRTNPDLANSDRTNPDLANSDRTNPNLANPDRPNSDRTNPDHAMLPPVDQAERRSAQQVVVVVGSTAIAALVALGLWLRWWANRNSAIRNSAIRNSAIRNSAIRNSAIKRPPSESERGQF